MPKGAYANMKECLAIVASLKNTNLSIYPSDVHLSYLVYLNLIFIKNFIRKTLIFLFKFSYSLYHIFMKELSGIIFKI